MLSQKFTINLDEVYKQAQVVKPTSYNFDFQTINSGNFYVKGSDLLNEKDAHILHNTIGDVTAIQDQIESVFIQQADDIETLDNMIDSFITETIKARANIINTLIEYIKKERTS